MEAVIAEVRVTASLRRRFAARLVDLLLLTPLAIADYFILPPSQVAWVVMSLLYAAYDVIFVTVKGGTPGKLLLGIYVCSNVGQKITPFRSLLRYVAFNFLYLASFLPFLLSVAMLANIISLLMALFDKKRRTLHDRIAGTQVLRGKAPPRQP